MNPEFASKIIAEWLFEATLPELLQREAVDDIAEPGKGAITAVVGTRRAGKTYFLFQKIERLIKEQVPRDEILFLDFEDYRLKGFKPDDISIVFEGFQRLTSKQPRYLFFDEIQQVPDWNRLLRTLHNQHKYSITVTGSNSSLLTREIAVELRGRYQDVLLMPFSFREYLRFKNVDFSTATLNSSRRGSVRAAFDEWLFNGGYPEICVLSDATARRRLLQNYYETIFYRDIVDRYGVKARDLLDGIMSAVVNGSGELFSVSAYASQLARSGLSGSKRSIASYLRYLQEAFFLISSEKFSWSARKRTMNPEKVYLTDTGFSLLPVSGSDNRGKLLETAIAGEFFRNGRKTCYYKNKRECDFIVMNGSRPESAWQVCWSLDDKNEKREVSGLLEARNALKIGSGGIITADRNGSITESGIEIKIVSAIDWFLNHRADQSAG
jgi:hypothetical protein